MQPKENIIQPHMLRLRAEICRSQRLDGVREQTAVLGSHSATHPS